MQHETSGEVGGFCDTDLQPVPKVSSTEETLQLVESRQTLWPIRLRAEVGDLLFLPASPPPAPSSTQI